MISNLRLQEDSNTTVIDCPIRVPTHLMSETEWRSLGVQQSQGWIHYMRHEPEPQILLFRRPVPPHIWNFLEENMDLEKLEHKIE
ncbi:hypothetical protein KUTeg_018440 [Tegillarca granosa]|uniref:Cyclin-dependent kinases regulatory subunit n=1 Tax=Tegillarca granosa TaxID=220873 RepID=A0ABQ9EMP5_TEGGR|nr:hypothetical protein KUTeg_018440 [Tegillarca granosa]